MNGLILASVVGVVLALWAADRLYRAHVRARRRRMMTRRLAAASAQAQRQHEERQARAVASSELTVFVPAIKHPSLSVPGGVPPGGRSRVGREHPADRPADRPVNHSADHPADRAAEESGRPEHGSGRESRSAEDYPTQEWRPATDRGGNRFRSTGQKL